MKATFEKLNEQEMINVIGGNEIIMYIDKNGNVWYILIEDGRP